ncbi:MAG: zinc metallopeptidase [Calditrichaeota bacterium]|nr:zinc metallopeptidase [Calditrichota bacterium]
MMFPFFDPTFVLLIPAMILAFWAQAKVKSAYQKYSEVRSAAGLTGAQVARKILNLNGINDVEVEAVEGELSDHYDPRSRKVRLSEGIYGSSSLAALGIAAHEVGHAIQHQKGYLALQLRHLFLWPANIGSTLAMPIFFVGLIFSSFKVLMDVGIILFLGALTFQLITLPVEFDASRRALAQLRGTGLMADYEISQTRKVLTAAAWTYVAAATVTLMHLLRMILLRNSRD